MANRLPVYFDSNLGNPVDIQTTEDVSVGSVTLNGDLKIISGGIDLKGNTIANCMMPVSNQDLSNKAYVDSSVDTGAKTVYSICTGTDALATGYVVCPNAAGGVGRASAGASMFVKRRALGVAVGASYPIKVVHQGLVEGAIAGATIGKAYWLSDSASGPNLVPNPPTSAGCQRVRVGYAITTTSLVVDIQDYGKSIGGSISDVLTPPAPVVPSVGGYGDYFAMSSPAAGGVLTPNSGSNGGLAQIGMPNATSGIVTGNGIFDASSGAGGMAIDFPSTFLGDFTLLVGVEDLNDTVTHNIIGLASGYNNNAYTMGCAIGVYGPYRRYGVLHGGAGWGAPPTGPTTSPTVLALRHKMSNGFSYLYLGNTSNLWVQLGTGLGPTPFTSLVIGGPGFIGKLWKPTFYPSYLSDSDLATVMAWAAIKP